VRKTSGHLKPVDRWEVLIEDHHPGYIDWKRYMRNVLILEENAYMKPATGRKSARGGRSLLSGLLRCRRCGHTLQVSYRGNDSTSSAFRCARGHHRKGSDWCLSFGGKRVEEVVASQVLQAIESKAIDAAIEASHRAEQKRLDQRNALVLELDQARYEAQLAARRYERVDPDMRLVAAELEARWDRALERVREIQARVASFDARASEKSDVDERALRALANDLPALWHDEETDMRLKQRIVRIIVHEIIADVDDATNEIVLLIHWQGGRHTEVRVPKSVSGRTRRCNDDDAVELVRRMAGRWSDDAIAGQLNRLGWQTGTGNNWTRARVRSLRSRLDLPAFNPELRDHSMLTAKEAARRLGISKSYLGQLLARGVIPGTQLAPGTPWWVDAEVLESNEVREALRALSQRRPVRRKSSNPTLRIPGV
jgi:excisionase family DNA binding protein